VLHGSLEKDGQYFDQGLWTILDRDWRRTRVVHSTRIHWVRSSASPLIRSGSVNHLLQVWASVLRHSTSRRSTSRLWSTHLRSTPHSEMMR